MKEQILSYFGDDELSSDAWAEKYQMKSTDLNEDVEPTPDEMHKRLAKEFARIEFGYINKELSCFSHKLPDELSDFGKNILHKRIRQSLEDIEEEIYNYFKGFNQIVPQGSIMANLGNKYVFGSLSNCFGIAPPLDSYGGIMRTDEELAQLMKRRGGVGTHLNNIRPTFAYVSNASRSSTGVPTYAERFSNTTREVAQEGRRGALMLLLSVKHPDIFRFITMKDDRTKVTGANVSVMFTDEFMEAVEKDKDFLCAFPIDAALPSPIDINYNELEYNNSYKVDKLSYSDISYIMKVRAKELFDEFVHMAHSNAEPGAAFIDRIIDYSPDGVYDAYIPEVSNPCGEQWFHRYDTCRLIALNFFGIVLDPFTGASRIDFDKLYEISYIQQRLGDDLVDLEAEYIDRIIDKINKDPEFQDIKNVELNLWKEIKKLALAGRRTGDGFTALGDMLAAILKPYVSLDVIEKVMKTKMRAELDATIDMAILRGPFIGWDASKEWLDAPKGYKKPANSFFEMLDEEFEEQSNRMQKYGRRNVSWSTVAPTGTVSLMTQTTSGLEPLFKAYYIRRKKINANQKEIRVDYVDQNGDSWQEYAVLHPKFKEWCNIRYIKHEGIEEDFTGMPVETWTKDEVEKAFKASPWYGSQAEDISWEDRIAVNAIIQKYTSNSLSCTVNLPKDVSEDTVHNLYFHAWKSGLKGITVYRDGSRSGVLVTEVKQITVDEFGYLDAPDRPEILQADYFYLKHGGKEFGIFVGKWENHNPYEIFAIETPDFKENIIGQIVKVGSGHYDFISDEHTFTEIQDAPLELRKTCRFASGMLRHRMHPKYICEQVDKAEVLLTDFSKAIQRVLKTYISDEETGEKCSNCENGKIVYSEGCKKCDSCSYSKC